MKSLMITLLCFFVIEANAQQTWSLRAVLDSLEQNNPALKQYQYQKSAQYSMAKATKSWEAPTVMAGLQEFPYGPATMDTRKMIMIGAEQMFPNFKEQKSRAKYYESLGNLSDNDFGINKRKLILMAKEAYFSWFIASKQLLITEEQLKLVNVLIKMAEARIPYGKADLPSVYEARAKAADMQAMKIEQHALIAKAKTALNYVLGHDVNYPLAIDTAMQLRMYGDDLLSISQDTLKENRSDIARMSNQIKSFELNKLAIADSKKSTFGIGWQNMRMADGTYMTNLTATMKIPSFSWSARKIESEIKAADFEISQMSYKQQDMLNESAANIQAYYYDLKSMYEAVHLYEKQIIPAFKKTFDASLNSYGENTGDMNKVLMAWENLTAKKSLYWNKYGEALRLEANLENEIEIK